MSLTRAVCAACASSSVSMALDTCPAANVWIWWIAKTGHDLSEAGRAAVGSLVGMASVCCGHPRGTSMPLTNSWYAATSGGPSATGSIGRILGAMCLPRQTRRLSGGLGVGLGVGEWGNPAGPRPWGAWSQRSPSRSDCPAVVA